MGEPELDDADLREIDADPHADEEDDEQDEDHPDDHDPIGLEDEINPDMYRQMLTIMKEAKGRRHAIG